MNKYFELDPLYELDSKDGVKFWQIRAEGNDELAYLITRHGKDGGNLQEARREVRGKNLGRSNETTAFDQAVAEAKAKHKKKVEKGASTDRDALADGPMLPMLAQPFAKYSHKIVFPCMVQPKLNGVRCLAKRTETGMVYTSRNGKIFTTLDHLTPHLMELLEPGAVLDGEIYIHHTPFQEIVSLVKKQQVGCERLQYWIYDQIDAQPFQQRAWDVAEGLPEDHPMLVHVDTLTLETMDQIHEQHNRYIAEGFEGIMIRNIHGRYVCKHRSQDLIKLKNFVDEEFMIIGGTEGAGSDAGCVVFKCVTPGGKEFDVRPKGTVAYRQQLYKDLDRLVGQPLTVRYQELSLEGVPIFPVGCGIRDYE